MSCKVRSTEQGPNPLIKDLKACQDLYNKMRNWVHLITGRDVRAPHPNLEEHEKMLTKAKDLIANYPVTSIITIIVVITVLSLGIGSFVESFNEINAG